uniref:Uncharacterized protein n=1 Tax=Tanacetum cinerariifolium TaxID=118510 RepID=A0A699HIR8_TANCI|nr:hypothetical protein [Tanacetum cinerariifolium]
MFSINWYRLGLKKKYCLNLKYDRPPRDKSTPSSTPYPPKTSESFLDSSSVRSLDSSSPSAGPSLKRCRSPTTLVLLSTPVLRSIDPTHVDLSPPGKSIKDSYSPKDNREEHMEIDTTDTKVVVDLGISTKLELILRMLEAGQLMASGERAGLPDRIRRLG